MIRPPPSSTLFPYTPLSRPRAVLTPPPRRRPWRAPPSAPPPARRRPARTTRTPALAAPPPGSPRSPAGSGSEEHTSELQSRQYLVCRLLLEKKKHAHTEHRL